jgi:hypothetical protein
MKNNEGMGTVVLPDATGLSMWVVYEKPSDYPGSYVARLFHGTDPTTKCLVHASVEVIRNAMREGGLVRLERSEHDEPQIVEVWL